MTSKSLYPILTWVRNTERRSAAGEPPIRFYLLPNYNFVLRFVTCLNHFLGGRPGAERCMTPHPRKDKQ